MQCPCDLPSDGNGGGSGADNTVPVHDPCTPTRPRICLDPGTWDYDHLISPLSFSLNFLCNVGVVDYNSLVNNRGCFDIF